MTKMIIQQEIEATPKVVADHLREFAKSSSRIAFTFPVNALLRLKPQMITALGALPDLPVLVITQCATSAVGTVAYVKVKGGIGFAVITKDQVVEPWPEPLQ
jgi:hypothetical protein